MFNAWILHCSVFSFTFCYLFVWVSLVLLRSKALLHWTWSVPCSLKCYLVKFIWVKCLAKLILDAQMQVLPLIFALTLRILCLVVLFSNYFEIWNIVLPLLLLMWACGGVIILFIFNFNFCQQEHISIGLGIISFIKRLEVWILTLYIAKESWKKAGFSPPKSNGSFILALS